MEVVISENFESATAMAAGVIKQAIMRKKNLVLGLPTGKTPLRLYAELIRLHKIGQLDFSEITTFNLDEYVGLSTDNPSSYACYMRSNLFDHINISMNSVNIPDGLADDSALHAKEYEEKIKGAGGIDLQILGLGEDGHIGFNEPSSSLASRTRVKTITESTLLANSKYFRKPDEQPRHVITMGVATILDAKKIIVLAEGSQKSRAVAQMVEGPVSAMFPASALQMHPNVTVFIDKNAAKRLKLKKYYSWVYENGLPKCKYELS